MAKGSNGNYGTNQDGRQFVVNWHHHKWHNWQEISAYFNQNNVVVNSEPKEHVLSTKTKGDTRRRRTGGKEKDGDDQNYIDNND